MYHIMKEGVARQILACNTLVVFKFYRVISFYRKFLCSITFIILQIGFKDFIALSENV